MKCVMCGTENDTVDSQPTRSQLIFGGFPMRWENRCRKCEKKSR
jgi:hypothetical protein